MSDETEHAAKMRAAQLRSAEADARSAEASAREAEARARKAEAIADDICGALKNGRKPSSWGSDR